MPLGRSNSLIRGSGHSLTGNTARKGSILKGRKGQGDAVFDLILLHDISEDAVCENIKVMFAQDMIYVSVMLCALKCTSDF